MKGFIGLANYFRDNIPNMSSLLQPLQKMISGYTRSAKLMDANTEQQYEAVKNLGDCQKLFWMDENLPVSPACTDASDYGCGAYPSRKIVTEKSIHPVPIEVVSRPETMEYDRTGGVRDFLLAQRI
jgi:hypothetical protein